jgi:serine/threonine-protein kinase
MGDVYRAEHRGLGRPVALKILAASRARGELGQRFEREARASARLDHPSCVRVLDSGRWPDGTRYLAMELLDGQTLRERADAVGAFAAPAAIRIARELLEGLAHAHARDVLHRDLKPENVMFAVRGGVERAVLIDFGLAHVVGQPPLTGAGTCVGSPSYVAPERLLGRPYGPRADLYSLGILLYELLAGSRPFAAPTAEETARQHLSETPLALAALVPSLPPALGAVVARALEKDPDRRFADAESMLRALAAVEMTTVPGLRALRRAPPPPVPAGASERRDESTAIELTLAAPSRWSRLRSWWRHGAWRLPRPVRVALLSPDR